MRIIYYKDGKLNKTKTLLALTKYYLSDILKGDKPRKIITAQSDTEAL